MNKSYFVGKRQDGSYFINENTLTEPNVASVKPLRAKGPADAVKKYCKALGWYNKNIITGKYDVCDRIKRELKIIK